MSHQREIEHLLPQFQSLTNPYSVSPKVKFFDGMEGIERVMNETLTSRETIRCFSNVDAWFSNEATRDYIIWYGKRRMLEKKIPERALVLDSPSGRKYLEEDYPDNTNNELFQFRWLPKDINSFSNEINIYDNKLAIVCITKNELLGILIESEGIAATQKSIFEIAWRNAVPSKFELNKSNNGSIA